MFIFSEPDKNHNVQSWQLGLNIEQAKKLVYELNVSIARAEELDEMCSQHDLSTEYKPYYQVRKQNNVIVDDKGLIFDTYA